MKIQSPLACQQLVELVTDYLEVTLTPRQRRNVEDHLAHCSDCTAYLQQIQRIITLSGASRVNETGHEPLPAAIFDGLVQAFRDHHAPND